LLGLGNTSASNLNVFGRQDKLPCANADGAETNGRFEALGLCRAMKAPSLPQNQAPHPRRNTDTSGKIGIAALQPIQRD
jgi:hypothetical protein